MERLKIIGWLNRLIYVCKWINRLMCRNGSGLSLLDTVKPDPAFYDNDNKFWIKEEQKTRMRGTKESK